MAEPIIVTGAAGFIGRNVVAELNARGEDELILVDELGVSKPGEIVWSRVYIEDDELRMDLGRGCVMSLPEGETLRRWQATTPQWPIMHAVTYGVTRDHVLALQCVLAYYRSWSKEADKKPKPDLRAPEARPAT